MRIQSDKRIKQDAQGPNRPPEQQKYYIQSAFLSNHKYSKECGQFCKVDLVSKDFFQIISTYSDVKYRASSVVLVYKNKMFEDFSLFNPSGIMI